MQKQITKGVWVSFMQMQSWIFAGKTEEQAKANIDEITGTMHDNGLNFLAFHVRPFADALYPSKLFPVSHLFTGKQGDTLEWDPLRYLIDSAHAKGIGVHAWINPYRVASKAFLGGELADGNIAKRWQRDNNGNVLEYDGGIYFNPAKEEVRKLVVDGIAEIIESYPDVDGIHFDDYFYPTTEESFDRASFEDYRKDGGALGLSDWRRENVNILIREVYAKVKSFDQKIEFGISPQANYDNNYNGQHCDVALWLKTPGYTDYIAPQCYWGYEHNADINGMTKGAQFPNCIKYWTDLPRDPSVEMIIGIGSYNIGRLLSGGSDEWARPPYNKISRMVADVCSDERRSGFILFDYDGLWGKNRGSALITNASGSEFADSGKMEAIVSEELENLRNILL